MGLVWVGSFAVEYYVSLRHLAADEFMQSYWSKAFMPLPPWSEPGWFLRTYYSFLLMSFSTHITAVLLVPVLAFVGTLSLFSRNRSIALLVILPALMALLASALHKYPLKDRFMLFLVPFLLLLISEGLGRIHAVTVRWNRSLALLLAALPAILLIWTPGTRLQDFFITSRGSDVRPVIQYVCANRQPHDIVYLFHGSDPAFHYYAPRYGLTTGRIIVGFDTPRKRVALERFFDDVDALNGNDRVWFIFSDIYDCGDCEGDMQAFYVGYLAEFGRMLDQFNASGANAYLYDLNP